MKNKMAQIAALAAQHKALLIVAGVLGFVAGAVGAIRSRSKG